MDNLGGNSLRDNTSSPNVEKRKIEKGGNNLIRGGKVVRSASMNSKATKRIMAQDLQRTTSVAVTPRVMKKDPQPKINKNKQQTRKNKARSLRLASEDRDAITDMLENSSNTPRGTIISKEMVERLIQLGKKYNFSLCVSTLQLSVKQEYPTELLRALCWHYEQNDIVSLFSILLDSSLSNYTTAETMLRSDTPATMLMATLLREKVSSFLVEVCKPVLRVVLKTKSKTIEIDPLRTSKANQRDSKTKIVKTISKLIARIQEKLYLFPDEVREYLRIVNSKCEEKSPGSGLPMVGSFVFLRFISPAIISPNTYGLINASPSTEQTRSLVLVMKALQSIVTGVPFDGSKEQYMTILDTDLKPFHEDINNILSIIIGDSNLNPKKKLIVDPIPMQKNETKSIISEYFYRYSPKVYSTTTRSRLKTKLSRYIPECTTSKILLDCTVEKDEKSEV